MVVYNKEFLLTLKLVNVKLYIILKLMLLIQTLRFPKIT